MKILTGFLICILTFFGCQQAKDSARSEIVTHPKEDGIDTIATKIQDTLKVNSSSKDLNSNFPFELFDKGESYQIMAAIESPELYPKYYNLFKKYGYEGNGPCWEGHIIQILESLDKDLLKHIQFDSEAGAFYAMADSKANQLKFSELLSPIFSDIQILEQWIKKADHARIDD